MTGGQILFTAAAFLAGCAVSAVNFALSRRMLEKNVNNLTKLYFIHTLLILLIAAAVGAAAWKLGQNTVRCVAAAAIGATVPEIVIAAAGKKKR